MTQNRVPWEQALARAFEAWASSEGQGGGESP